VVKKLAIFAKEKKLQSNNNKVKVIINQTVKIKNILTYYLRINQAKRLN
jgi:hypothetical protein